MSIRYLLVILLSFCIGLPVAAQDKPAGTVELIELDSSIATFHVECFAHKKKDIIESAQITTLYKLLYEGVEGFNEDRKLIENENKYWLESFFKGKNAPYIGYVKGTRLEGEVEELPTGQYRGFAIVSVNYDSLIRTLKINKIIIDENASEEKVEPKEPKGFGIGVRKKGNQ